MKKQQSNISVFVAYPTIPSNNYEHQCRHDSSIQRIWCIEKKWNCVFAFRWLTSNWDELCIFSFEIHLWDSNQKYKVACWKALLVTVSQHCDLGAIVIRLGCFHNMSFLGFMGYSMSGAGICKALKVVYTRNSVHHLLWGKAVSRAIQNHQLLSMWDWFFLECDCRLYTFEEIWIIGFKRRNLLQKYS